MYRIPKDGKSHGKLHAMAEGEKVDPQYKCELSDPANMGILADRDRDSTKVIPFQIQAYYADFIVEK